MSITRKRKSDIEVETVPEDDFEDDEQGIDDDPSSEEIHLNQGTQHSQSTASLPTNESEAEADTPAEDTKQSPVELHGREMTFDKILDTFLSTETSDQHTWNTIFQTWDDIEEIGLAQDDAKYIDSFQDGSLTQTWATLGNKWTSENDADYISKEFKAMEIGSESWLADADQDIIKNASIPRAYLARTNQKNHFQVIHSRGKVRTPETEEEDSVLQDTWVAFTGDTADENGPSMVSLGKSPDTVKLFTAKPTTLASIYEIITDEPSETGCFSGAKPHHQKFNTIPSLLPLPWKWAATIAENPDWTVQTTTRFIILSCYGWLRSSDRDTVGNIMRFLMGATTGKTATAKKTNPKVLLPTKPFTTDEAAQGWLDTHKERMWTRLAQTPKRATPPRQRNTSARKQSPTTGAPNQTPTQGATSGDKRPSSHPQRGANKRATRATTASQPAAPATPATATPDLDDQHMDEDPEESTPTPPAPQPAATNPRTATTHSILTPELIASLRDNPATLKLIVDQVLANERELAQQQALHTTLSAMNTVAATAIKEAHAAGSGPTSKGKWNTVKQARFAAYAGLTPTSPRLPTFWKRLIQAASDDKESIIQELLNKLADEHDCFQSWSPPPHFIEDIKKLALRPGRTLKDFFRGLSPAAFADRDQAELQHAREQTKLHSNYTIHLNGAEAERLEAKAPPMPTTPEKLQLYLKRWTTFLEEVFGKECELVGEGIKLYRLLQRQLPRIMGTNDFMTRRGNSILWELSIATDEFFRQIITMQAYDLAAEDEDEPTPRATCTLNTTEILTLHGPAAGDLPTRLKPYLPPTKATYDPKSRQRTDDNNRTHSGGGGGGRGPSTSTRKGDWPDAFQQILGMYPPEERRRISLTRLLKAADTDRNWLQETLGMAAGCCCSTTVLGQCPEKCTLNHDFRVDPAKAKIVAHKLKSAVAVVTTERNIKRA